MSLILSNSESTLIKKLINYLDTYNILHEITKQNFINNKVISKFKDNNLEVKKVVENSDSNSDDNECNKNIL
jgi:hypothetical protein